MKFDFFSVLNKLNMVLQVHDEELKLFVREFDHFLQHRCRIVYSFSNLGGFGVSLPVRMHRMHRNLIQNGMSDTEATRETMIDLFTNVARAESVQYITVNISQRMLRPIQNSLTYVFAVRFLEACISYDMRDAAQEAELRDKQEQDLEDLNVWGFAVDMNGPLFSPSVIDQMGGNTHKDEAFIFYKPLQLQMFRNCALEWRERIPFRFMSRDHGPVMDTEMRPEALLENIAVWSDFRTSRPLRLLFIFVMFGDIRPCESFFTATTLSGMPTAMQMQDHSAAVNEQVRRANESNVTVTGWGSDSMRLGDYFLLLSDTFYWAVHELFHESDTLPARRTSHYLERT